MALSSNLNAYRDVQTVLDAALSAGGARYKLETNGAAIHWRHRAYYYRKLLHNQKKEQNMGIPGILSSTPYDHLKMTLEDNVVVIQLIAPTGQLETLDGEPLNLAPVHDHDEDELEREVQGLVEMEGKDEGA